MSMDHAQGSAQSAGLGAGLDERQPVLIVLDTSGSMGRPAEHPRIDDLNRALGTIFRDIAADPRLRSRVEICLLSFGTDTQVYDVAGARMVPADTAVTSRAFAGVDALVPPTLTADGYTRMVDALEFALELGRCRHEELTAQCVPVLRPLIWLVTDGAPSDEHGRPLQATELAPFATRMRRSEASEVGGVLFTVGVRGADRDMLAVLAPRGTVMLEGLDFKQILSWALVSSDRVGGQESAEDIHSMVAEQAAMRAELEALEEERR
ncbi:hypothetical protein [Streptomyces sp. RKAG293]|uniref:vWA domain-containing protein n=1 Tax=Streptomyces sp. RKAG293 TaxID=2893403 RepID=UPI002033A977|nr:hypothetical protein [Streptomyces sp. RKAG293]MCM2422621.1 hypothetical protein [Streptomyces sp. RKAG293]